MKRLMSAFYLTQHRPLPATEQPQYLSTDPPPTNTFPLGGFFLVSFNHPSPPPKKIFQLDEYFLVSYNWAPLVSRPWVGMSEYISAGLFPPVSFNWEGQGNLLNCQIRFSIINQYRRSGESYWNSFGLLEEADGHTGLLLGPKLWFLTEFRWRRDVHLGASLVAITVA